MPKILETLVITVDVECDSDGGPTWRYSSPASFRGVEHGIGSVLVPILEEAGAVATLLVSNVVLCDEGSVKMLRDFPRVEHGAHLHGDFLPPEPRFSTFDGAKTVENQCEYSAAKERAKLVQLGQLYRDAFGREPQAFRAGRWSAGGRTASILSELGYLVDSSVSPHMHWTDGGRSVDYRAAPDQPYQPSSEDIARPGRLPLWELPVSIAVRKYAKSHPAWLRPSLSGVRTMQRVIRAIRKGNPRPRTFVMMFHNNELTPGASPYSRTVADASMVAARLRSFISWAADEGMQFSTLTEAAHACASQ